MVGDDDDEDDGIRLLYGIRITSVTWLGDFKI